MKAIYKLTAVGLFATIAVGGLFAAIKFDWIENDFGIVGPPHYVKKPKFGSNFLGKPRREYFNQLSSVSQTEKSHIPFSDSKNPLRSRDDNFVISKKNFIFANDAKADEDKEINWSCEVTFSNRWASLTNSASEKTTQETCRFFIFPNLPDFSKCHAYAEDLKFLPFYHLTNQNQLPPVILLSILKEENFSMRGTPKKIVLKKNNKDYLSINEEAFKHNYCYLSDQDNLNYFLVKASIKQNQNETLFIKSKKNYFCSENEQTNVLNTYHFLSNERFPKCDILELKNHIDANTSNLPQYISDLKKETIVKDVLKDEKLYILKTTKENRYEINESIWLHNEKNDKVHGKLEIIAKITITYDDDRPDFYYPIVDYKQKQQQKIIVKANKNWISSTNTDNFQCFYKGDKKTWGFYSKSVLNKCKIYKFERDVFDIKNVSFKKAAKLVTNPKTEIKEGAYYILHIEVNKNKWNPLDKWLEKDLYTFVFGSDADNNKVDLYLDTRFFGDFTKDASETNNFFLFTDEDKNTKNTVNNSEVISSTKKFY